MPDRLTKITTRGGDKGETSLGDGSRVAKTDPRIALLGEVDELNSWIGVVLAHWTCDEGAGDELRPLLEGIQHDLFDLGGALCFPGTPVLSEKHLARLDAAVEQLNADLPPLKEFILPGGAPSLSWLHVARTVSRRVERTMAGLPIDGAVHAYLNRLSDVLFIAARVEARRLNISEVYWQKEKSVS